MAYERLTERQDDGTVKYLGGDKDTLATAYEKLKYRLCELEDKIESGQAVVLPCKVGDKFYEVIPGLPVREWIVDEFIISKERIVIFGWLNTGKGGFWKFWVDDFGKTIFTTKEAAEAKLKELRGEE